VYSFMAVLVSLQKIVTPIVEYSVFLLLLALLRAAVEAYLHR